MLQYVTVDTTTTPQKKKATVVTFCLQMWRGCFCSQDCGSPCVLPANFLNVDIFQGASELLQPAVVFPGWQSVDLDCLSCHSLL